MSKYTKEMLINDTAANAGITKKQAKKIVNSIFETVKSQVTSGNQVNLFGFANFYPVTTKDTTRIIPKTDITVKVPAKKIVRIKPTKQFSAQVRG